MFAEIDDKKRTVNCQRFLMNFIRLGTERRSEEQKHKQNSPTADSMKRYEAAISALRSGNQNQASLLFSTTDEQSAATKLEQIANLCTLPSYTHSRLIQAFKERDFSISEFQSTILDLFQLKMTQAEVAALFSQLSPNQSALLAGHLFLSKLLRLGTVVFVASIACIQHLAQ